MDKKNIGGDIYIRIANLEAVENKLKCKFDFSENIAKYFKTDQFSAEYDKNIENIDKSILSIPPLANVITVAWANGADIYVDKLDKNFLDSLGRIELVFKKWFPQFSFSTNINVENLVSNRFGNDGYGLLFTSGVDSLSSYILHKEKKPTLISIWGADVPTEEYLFWNRIKSLLENFAVVHGANIHFIKTNGRELLNDLLLATEYKIGEGWWGEVYHSLFLLGLCAPLTITEKIGTIFIASSFPENLSREPWGSHPLIDNNISWADNQVLHDAYELGRQEKIRNILKVHPEYLKYLRVCHIQYSKLNCGVCEKCLRTITNLVLEDMDPNKYNFDINESIFDLIKNFLDKGLISIREKNWQNILDNIPEKLEDDKIYNSKEFFEWLKELDISGYKYRGDSKVSNLLQLYYLARYRGLNYVFRRAYHYILQKFRFNGQNERD